MTAALVVAAGCGGGGNSPGGTTPIGAPSPTNPAPTDGAISVGVTGLSGSGLVLDIAGRTLSLSPGTTTALVDGLTPGLQYGASVLSHPRSPDQLCKIALGESVTAVSHGSGIVHVHCGTASSVGVLVNGLKESALELVLNNGDVLALTEDSRDFDFPSTLVSGTGFAVGIRSQPSGQTCTLRGAKGLVPDSGRARVSVACMDNGTSPLWGAYRFEPSPGRRGYLVFLPDGTYSLALRMDDPACGDNQGNGVEYGVYRWNETTSEFAIRSAVVDTNGRCGVADSTSGEPKLLAGTLARAADALLIRSGATTLTLRPLPEPDWSPIVGGWATGSGISAADKATPGLGVTGAFTVFDTDGVYVSVETQQGSGSNDLRPGLEWGCYTFGPGLVGQDPCNASMVPPVDLNGQLGGLSDRWRHGEFNAVVAGDTLRVESIWSFRTPTRTLDDTWFRVVPR